MNTRYSTGLLGVGLLFLASGLALAGPNAGGTLIVHDTGFAYSSDMSIPPVTPPPAECAGVDNDAPADSLTVWKVYAAFPDGSSPRLKGFSWGITMTASVHVLGAGLPDPIADFEVPQDGFPFVDGGSVGMAFGSTQTDLINECYWFGGYSSAGGVFGTAPHAVDTSYFVDDSEIPLVDEIAGFSSIGFGEAGITVCAWLSGACCFADGSCQVQTQASCIAAGGVPQPAGTVCSPNPCPAFGACCDLAFGTCQITTEADCGAQGLAYLADNVPCTPNPCQQPPTGACCHTSGSCDVMPEAACEHSGTYQGDGTSCNPNPCPPPATGACCNYESGYCSIMTQEDCAYWGFHYEGDGTTCIANPCPQYGACCVSWGGCYLHIETDCAESGGSFLGEGTDCSPNPCPPGGACCLSDESCMLYTESICTSHGGSWQGPGSPCTPNPCSDPVPTERTSWGRVKNLFR